MLETRARLDTLPVILGLLGVLFVLGFVLGDVILLTLAVALAFGIAAVGVDLLLGYGGQPCMGQSAFIAIGAYVSTLMMLRFGLPFPIALLLAIAVSVALALVIGAAAVKLERLGFAIVTFMFSYVVFVLLGGHLLSGMVGSSGGLAVPPAMVAGIDLSQGRALYFLSLALLAASVLVCAFFVRSRSGLALITLKQNEVVAAVLGIDVQAAKRRVFAVSAALGSIGGVLFAQTAGYLTAESFDPSMSVAVFGMAAVGGLGSLAGGIVGAIFYRLIPQFGEHLQGLHTLLFALFMLLSLIAFQNGLYGVLEMLLNRIMGGRKSLSQRSLLTGPKLQESQTASSRDAPVADNGASGTAASGGRVGAMVRAAVVPGSGGDLLVIAALNVAFGGVKALSDVSMKVRAGSTHALIGANGAGKTTLLNCINGIVKPRSGEILLAGRDLRQIPCHRLRTFGVARTFQNPSLSPDLTLLENAKLGLYASHSWSNWRDWSAGLASRSLERNVEELAIASLELVGLASGRWRVHARDASFGEQKLVDLARALCGAQQLLLLDEPAAGLTGGEIEYIVHLLHRLRTIKQLTIVLVSHHVHLVRDIADQVTVLDFGRVLAEGTPQEISSDPRVVDAFLGGEHAVA